VTVFHHKTPYNTRHQFLMTYKTTVSQQRARPPFALRT